MENWSVSFTLVKCINIYRNLLTSLRFLVLRLHLIRHANLLGSFPVPSSMYFFHVRWKIAAKMLRSVQLDDIFTSVRSLLSFNGDAFVTVPPCSLHSYMTAKYTVHV